MFDSALFVSLHTRYFPLQLIMYRVRNLNCALTPNLEFSIIPKGSAGIKIPLGRDIQ